MVEKTGSSKKRISSAVIADALELRIRGGDIQTGALLPTERELQDEFEASRSTVRKSLSLLVDRGIASGIPNRGTVAGRADVRPPTSNIAFIDGHTYVLRNIFVRLSSKLRELGFHLVHLDSEMQPLEDCLAYAADNLFAGAIVWPFEGFPDQARVKCFQKTLPIIALDHGLRGIDTDLSAFDNFEAGRLAADHLFRQGHRRMLITGVMDSLEINHDRFSGALRATFQNGLTPNSIDFQFCSTSGMNGQDVSKVRSRLASPDRPDCILVLQDEYVPSILEAVFAEGLRVPEDISLMTIGDDVAVTVNGASLSAIAVDWEQMILNAVTLLKRRLAHPTLPYQRLNTNISLKVRGLCGAPKEFWDMELDNGLNPYQAIERQNPKLHIRLVSQPSAFHGGRAQSLIAEKIK